MRTSAEVNLAEGPKKIKSIFFHLPHFAFAYQLVFSFKIFHL